MEAHKQGCIDSGCAEGIMQLFMAFPGQLLFDQICVFGLWPAQLSLRLEIL